MPVTLNLLGHLSNSNDLTGGTPYAELKVNGTQRGIWGMVLAYLGVEDREALRMQCKTTAKLEQEQNWLPQWVAVYPTVGNARALRWMQRHRPPHVKRSLSGRGPGGVPAVPRAAPTAALRYSARRGGARDRVSSGARFASCPGSPRGRRLSRTALGGRRWDGLRIKTPEVCAVYGPAGLASVDVLEGVTTIGARSFCQCTSLASITLPAGLETIAEYAFHGCTSLG